MIASRSQALQVDADLKNLTIIREFVQEQMDHFDVDPDAISPLVLGTDELATNIILHGYERQPGSIEVEVRVEGDTLAITLRDRAPLFDPNTIPAPDTSLPLEERALGGMGIFLARRASDELRHRARAGGGNEVSLIKFNAIR